MANQSAFSSAVGHNAGELSRLHMRSSPHIDVLSGRGMLGDGSAYIPVSKRQRLGLSDKMGESIDHPAFARYQMDGK